MTDNQISAAAQTPMPRSTPTPAPAHGSTWADAVDPMPVADTSLLPIAEQPTVAADKMVQRVAQAAHATIDRLADQAAPAVRQLATSASSAEVALQAKADQLRQTGLEWSEGLRSAVRQNPLASVLGALALGALVARITR